jgi:hypothetical protein
MRDLHDRSISQGAFRELYLTPLGVGHSVKVMTFCTPRDAFAAVLVAAALLAQRPLPPICVSEPDQMDACSY